MITKESLRKLDDIGFIGMQRKMTKKQYLEEMRLSGEALKKYKEELALQKKKKVSA